MGMAIFLILFLGSVPLFYGLVLIIAGVVFAILGMKNKISFPRSGAIIYIVVGVVLIIAGIAFINWTGVMDELSFLF